MFEKRSGSGRTRLKLWTAIVLLALTLALFLMDERRAELLGAAASRIVPAGAGDHLTYRVDGPRGISVGSAPLFRGFALDPKRAPRQRLGAAELYWLNVSLGGAGFHGEAFDDHFELLIDLADELPEEPAFGALAIDALRAHRNASGAGGSEEEAERERVLSREVSRICAARDVDNGFYDLFEAELALGDGRFEEARTSLIAASRAPYVDSMLRRRSAAAFHQLRSLGLPGLEAREFLIDDGYARRDFSGGDLLERVASELGRQDARRIDAEPGLWIETFVALHRIGWRLVETAWLEMDAAQARSAANAYLDGVRAGVRNLHRPVPRPLTDGRSIGAMSERLAAAGYARGAAMIQEAEAGELARAMNQAGQRRRGRRSSEQILRVTAAHGILLPWALVSVAAALLLLPTALRASRRRVPIPSSAGLDFAAALFPIGCLIFAGSQGIYPFSRSVRGFEWIETLGTPPFVIYLTPLLAAVVLTAPHLLLPRFRNGVSYGRRLAGFFAGYGLLLLLTFAATATQIQDERARRELVLNGSILSLPDQPVWPEPPSDT